jgi:hypothetical protein
MTDDELKERAAIYRQLLDFKPFQYLMNEVNKNIEEIKEEIVTDLTKERLCEKWMMAGMKTVLTIPLSAIREVENLNEDNEAIEGTS